MPEPPAAIRPSQAGEQPPVTQQQPRIEGRLALIAEQPPAVAQAPTEEARWRTVVRPTIVRQTVEPRVRAAVRLRTEEVQVPTAVPPRIEEAQVQTAVPLRIEEAQTQTAAVQRQVVETQVQAVEALWRIDLWRIEEVQTRAAETPWRIGEAPAPAAAEQWPAAVGHRPVTLAAAAVTPQLEVGEATAGRAVLSQA